MKLIIGLGNPGEKYKNNRHNVGYIVIDVLEKAGLSDGTVAKKTNVFMNNSGEAVKQLVTRYLVTGDSKRKTSHEPTSYESLYIIHDDLDIPLGQYKIQKGKGPKLHYGIQSIDKTLGTGRYWRVRVGVDNRTPENRVPGEKYVLEDFTKEEKKTLDDVVKKIIDKLLI